MSDARAAGWDRAYLGSPPWDIGRAQGAFAALAGARDLGAVVELGCGTGENLLSLAASASVMVGVDISPRAVALARDKAARRAVPARFEVGDALDSASLPVDFAGSFNMLIDSGTFHLFDAADQQRYAAVATDLIQPGGRAHLLCAQFDPHRPWGPAGVDPDDVADAFGDGWRTVVVSPAVFEVATPIPPLPATLITLRHLPQR